MLQKTKEIFKKFDIFLNLNAYYKKIKKKKFGCLRTNLVRRKIKAIKKVQK